MSGWSWVQFLVWPSFLFNMNTINDGFTIDTVTGQVSASVKPLSDDGELDLSFDKWHQAWHHLLDLIKTYLPNKFLMWEVHYAYILNNHNHTESWPLYLAYDAGIQKRAIQLSIDPLQFSIGIWNDLESRYMAKKIYSLVQADLMSKLVLKHLVDISSFSLVLLITRHRVNTFT